MTYPLENPVEGEDQAVQDLLELTDPFQTSKGRGFHSMTLACLSGVFKVNPELDSDFKKGIAAGKAGEYNILTRISDMSPEVFNFLSVAFKMLKPDGSVLQDFIFNPVATRDFRDGDTKDIMQENARNAVSGFSDIVVFKDFLTELFTSPGGAQKMTDDAMLQTDVTISTNASDTFHTKISETQEFYSLDGSGQAPVAWGNDRGLRFWINAPKLPVSEAKLDSTLVEDAIKDYMSNSGDLVIPMYGQLQGCHDQIELNDVAWTSPKVEKIGELRLNSVVDGERCEKLGFTPFNHHPDHRPLSSMNRARDPIYKRGQERRGAKKQ